MNRHPNRRESQQNLPRLPLATVSTIVVAVLLVAGVAYLWYRARMSTDSDQTAPRPPAAHSFKIYGADAMAEHIVVASHVDIPEDGTFKQRLQLLADALSHDAFRDLPIRILRIEDRSGDRIAVIDLQEIETNRRVFAVQESLWAEGKGGEIDARKTYSQGHTWRLHFFQGSTGGYFTTMTLIMSFLQDDYEGEWIDAVEFYYEGRPISDEWDHIDLDGTRYRRAGVSSADSTTPGIN
jgi:hypothetical protein